MWSKPDAICPAGHFKPSGSSWWFSEMSASFSVLGLFLLLPETFTEIFYIKAPKTSCQLSKSCSLFKGQENRVKGFILFNIKQISCAFNSSTLNDFTCSCVAEEYRRDKTSPELTPWPIRYDPCGEQQLSDIIRSVAVVTGQQGTSEDSPVVLIAYLIDNVIVTQKGVKLKF